MNTELKSVKFIIKYCKEMSIQQLAIVVPGVLGLYYIYKYFNTKAKISDNDVIISNNEVIISNNQLELRLAEIELENSKLKL